MTSNTPETNKHLKELPDIPIAACSDPEFKMEVDAENGKTFHFTAPFLDETRAYHIYISNDQRRIAEEAWVVKEGKKLKLYRKETFDGLEDGVQENYFNPGLLWKRVEYTAGKRNGFYEGYDTWNGTLENKGKYKDDKKEGIWEHYFNGKLDTEITYSKGKYEGVYKRYTERNGELELEERKYYVNGELSGISETFLSGRLYRKIGYLNGKKDGVYIRYQHDGETPDTVGAYSNGKKTGEWTYYAYGNLVAKTENYKDGKKHGLCKDCHFRTTKQHGVEIDYVVEVNYINGVKDGEFPYEEFDKNGELVLKGSLINNKKEGVWNHYKNNELVAQDFYEDNKLVGTIQSNIPPVSNASKLKDISSDSSKRKTRTEQVEDLIYKYEVLNDGNDSNDIIGYNPREVKDGLYQLFDCNGHLLEEGYYCANKKVGIWKSFDEEGELTKETPYDNGMISGIVKRYIDDGQLYRRLFVSEKSDEAKRPYETYFDDEIWEQGECIMDPLTENRDLPFERDVVIRKFRYGRPVEDNS